MRDYLQFIKKYLLIYYKGRATLKVDEGEDEQYNRFNNDSKPEKVTPSIGCMV